MKRIVSYLFVFSLLIFTLTGCSNKEDLNEQNTNRTINAERVSGNVSIEKDNLPRNEIHLGAHETIENPEEEIASFSTKLGGSDCPRTRNISITTSILNETIVKNGETFSFCDTIRKTNY